MSGSVETALDAVASGIEAVTDAIFAAVAWVGGAIGWLGHLLDPTTEILARLWPAVLAVIITVTLLRLVRWLLLVWRGRTPRVQISNFAWASADGTSEEATWVTALFRERLAALRLDGLDPLPERAPGAPLVELVEGVGHGVSRDIGNAVGRLFKAAWPDSAYEVWATLRPRGNSGGKISVQLIERRRGNRTLLNIAVEGPSWEDGAHQAAIAVAGALYPRVRPQDRGPWTLWERTVPRRLLGHYHAARRFEEKDCLEPAMDEYHAALDLDPLNPNLRLKIAMLQERLGLYLDAWVTYEAIVDETDRRAWRGPNRRVYLLALYRLAVMLSNGQVAAQWVKRSDVPAVQASLRDRERQKRRLELERSLARQPLFRTRWIRLAPNEIPKRFTRFASRYIEYLSATGLLTVLRTLDDKAQKPGDALGPFQAREDNEDQKRRVEAVLQILSLRRLEELETALRMRPPLIPRRWRWRDWWIRRPRPRQWLARGEFAKSAVRTSKLLVRIRTAASLEGQLKSRQELPHPDYREQWTREIRQAHRGLTRRWPFPPVNWWRTALHFLAPRRRWANRREDSWQLHYNAACVTASLLRDDSVVGNSKEEGEKRPLEDGMEPLSGDAEVDRVTRRAIDQLEEYAYRAGSNRVAAQADWVTIDDPDLSGLRETDEFKLWASHHLPRSAPRHLSTRRTDVKRFTARLVRDGARILAAAWRERAELEDPSAAEVVDWWRAETMVWTQLESSCREHLSWQERLRLLQTLQEWLTSAERKEKLDISHERRGTAPPDSMAECLFDELASLAGSEAAASDETAARSNGHTAITWAAKRSRHVRDAHEAGEAQADAGGTLRAREERHEALRAARVWTRLAETLEAELVGDGDHHPDPEEDEDAKKRAEAARNARLRKRIAAVREELAANQRSWASMRPAQALLAPARKRWNGRG